MNSKHKITLTLLAAFALLSLCSAFTFRNVAFVASLQRAQASEPSTNSWDGLYTNLVAWWKLTEASGTRYDSVGSLHLTEVGTVNTSNGLIYATAAGFDESTDSQLTCELYESIPFTFALWVQAPQVSTFNFFLENSPSDNSSGWYVFESDYFGDRLLSVFFGNVETQAGFLNTFAFGETNLIVCGHDGTNAWISYNGGARTNAPMDALDFIPHGTFVMGGRNAEYPVTGVIGPVGYWNRMLNNNDINELWNSGAGRKLYE